MKKFILLSIAGVLAAGAIIYSNNHKAPPLPASITETVPAQPEPPPQEVVSIPKSQPSPVVTEPQPVVAVAQQAATNLTPIEETNSIHKTVDNLLAARAEKQAMFEQLRKDGQLEAVIAELQQRAAADPKNAKIPTTLGEAQLNLVRALHEAGNADQDQIGILAMQADQSFNAALKIDPQNWEAQFVKASTMFYWPADQARDSDAAQRLAHLIDQQETMPTQPVFVQTYLALGNQYQKMGKLNEAVATWQLGLQKFPGDPALLKKIAGQ